MVPSLDTTWLLRGDGTWSDGNSVPLPTPTPTPVPEVKEKTKDEDPDLVISAGATEHSTVYFPRSDDLVITSVDVYVEITHPNNCQLVVSVLHPDGTTSTALHPPPGPCTPAADIFGWYYDRAEFDTKRSEGTWGLYVQNNGVSDARILTWTLRVYGTEPPKTVTLEYTQGGDVTIPDGGVAESTITIPTADDLIITEVDVYVGIDHTDIGDLTVTLLHPDGITNEVLHSGAGGCVGPADLYKWYRDITAFNGNKHSEGTWRLRVQDAAGCGSGEIDYWILEIEGTPRPVVVASAVVGDEPVIAWATSVTSGGFNIQLINKDGGNPGASSVQWIAVAVERSVGVLAPDSRLAIQTEHLERRNAIWVDFPIHFDPGITAVVNNAYSGSTFEPYITCPRSVGPARFISAFIDDTGGSPDWAWLQTIAVGEGAPDTNLLIQAGSSAYSATTYSDGDFIFFPTSFAGTPVVVANAYDGANPVIASARGNATSGFFISLMYWTGANWVPVPAAAPVDVQWIAVGPRP
ncbi:MAG: hypothetical protein E3J65_01610 [Dehalococcoidia bacterium]|nr:MAG: hypothetical protein E3J65_01610 [Dehalococcoidia bacterium]